MEQIYKALDNTITQWIPCSFLEYLVLGRYFKFQSDVSIPRAILTRKWLHFRPIWFRMEQCSKCFCIFIPNYLKIQNKNKLASIFLFLFLGYNHQLICQDESQKSPEFYNRTASESNVYLNTFHFPDHSYKDHAFDTLSLDSSDSMETSISACSPDNISR